VVHIYKFQGDYFPSVTTILGEILDEPEGLTQWKLKNLDWEKTTNRSAIIGTLVHYRILNELAPQTLELPDIPFDEIPADALKRVELSQLMWEELDLKVGHPRKVEKFAVNQEYKFAGKPDLVAPINDVYTLVDLKTSREIHDTHKLQLGGYHELLDRTPEQAMLVSLHPNERGNAHLRAHTVVIPIKELNAYADRFVEMTKEFHKRKLVEKLIKENGITY
jgi:hypothetical protein